MQRFYLKNFHVINPQLEDDLYKGSLKNLFSEKVENYGVGKNNDEKYDIANNTRFLLISFETPMRKKQIRVLDYDITEENALSGEQIFNDVIIFSLKER